MSVSVHPIMPAKAIESFDFRSRMDSSAAKFTAVNNPAPTKDPPKSFTFRPDPSATTIANGNSTVPGKPEEPSKQLHGSDNPEKSAWDLERPGSDAIRLHDDTNVTLAKRKRSLDGTHEHQEEEIRLPSRSAGSPMDAHMRTHEQARSALEHIEPERTIDSAGTGSESNRIWSEQPHQNVRSASPDEIHLAESLRRDLARHDSGAAHLSSGLPSADSTDRMALDSSESSPKRADDAPREHKKRAFTHRTKTGCMTCRKRKKKCDEHKPVCLNCTKGSFKCEGYEEDKIVHGAPGSHARGRASTHSSVTSNIQPYPVTRPSYTYPYDQHKNPPTPEATRKTADIFGSGPRDTWGKPLWPTDLSPNSQRTGTQPAPRPEFGRPDAFPGFPREPPRMSHESLVNAARLGTSIAPASAPPGSKTPPQITPSTLSTTYQSPLEATRFRERQRMLQGLPYHHYGDVQLTDDRNECKAAVERYNNASRQSQGASEEECGRLFKAIVIPELRRMMPNDNRPSGTVGKYVLIDPPFNCEYGFNIHLEDDVTIDPNCYMQDACRISVGKRTVIGPDVKFYGRICPFDPRARGGIRGLAIGAPITIESDCYIGGSCIIMAGVTIGRCSVILPGTVVDRDVPPCVEYGGHPPNIIRGLPISGEITNHNPHRHDLDDISSLMMKERGPAR